MLDMEETKTVVSGGEPLNKVNLIGYKAWLKTKYPVGVLYDKFDDQDEINEYLEMIIDVNRSGNVVLLPHYEASDSIFPDLTSSYFKGVIIGTEYVEGGARVPLGEVINSFIELYLLTGDLHIGNLNFKTLIQ